MPEIAKHIVIRRNGVTIDGTEVPWHIAAQSIEITIPTPGVDSGVVYLPILVDHRGSIDVDMDRKLDTAQEPR